MTSSNGNIFRVTGHLVPGEFPAQRPVTRNFDVLFYLRLNKRLSKQSSGWWLEENARGFSVASAITECWHKKVRHLRYVLFSESLQKH